MISNPFQGKIVRLGYGRWTEEVRLQVSEITQCGIRELQIWNNNRPTLVKEIAQIHFTTLVSLNLAGNKIESIEGLAGVQIAQIKKLYLWDNSITSVGDEEGCMAALQVLLIDENYFGDAKDLVGGFFPRMEILFVYSQELFAEEKNRLGDKCFPAKMQAASIQQLNIHSHKFYFDRSIKTVLQKRWPQADIK